MLFFRLPPNLFVPEHAPSIKDFLYIRCVFGDEKVKDLRLLEKIENILKFDTHFGNLSLLLENLDFLSI